MAKRSKRRAKAQPPDDVNQCAFAAPWPAIKPIATDDQWSGATLGGLFALGGLLRILGDADIPADKRGVYVASALYRLHVAWRRLDASSPTPGLMDAWTRHVDPGMQNDGWTTSADSFHEAAHELIREYHERNSLLSDAAKHDGPLLDVLRPHWGELAAICDAATRFEHGDAGPQQVTLSLVNRDLVLGVRRERASLRETLEVERIQRGLELICCAGEAANSDRARLTRLQMAIQLLALSCSRVKNLTRQTTATIERIGEPEQADFEAAEIGPVANAEWTATAEAATEADSRSDGEWAIALAGACNVLSEFWPVWDEARSALKSADALLIRLAGDEQTPRLQQWPAQLGASLRTLEKLIRWTRDDLTGGVDLAAHVTCARSPKFLDDWLAACCELATNADELERLSADFFNGVGNAAIGSMDVDDFANRVVEVNTAGDLWKAFAEGKTPAVTSSSIAIRKGPNVTEQSFPSPGDQDKQNNLRKALLIVRDMGGDRAEAMHTLIERIAVSMNVDPTKVINMPLAEFVAASGRRVARPDTHGSIDDLEPKTPTLNVESGPIEPVGNGNKTPTKQPPKKAFQAWRLRLATGINNQTELAAKMIELGHSADQGQVSRWLGQVEEYLNAGGIFPPMDVPTRKPPAMDPSEIDKGERQDRRTPRQRERRDSDSGDE